MSVLTQGHDFKILHICINCREFLRKSAVRFSYFYKGVLYHMDIDPSNTPISPLNVGFLSDSTARSYDFTADEVLTIISALFRDVSKTKIAGMIGITRPTLETLMKEGTQTPSIRAKFHIACRDRANDLRKDIRQAQNLLD